MLKNNHQPFILEITVISAQGLKNPSSILCLHRCRLRPFITLTTLPYSTPNKPTNGDRPRHVYQSRVDDKGGTNPTWGDRFHIPLDATFFSYNYSSVYLQLYTKRLVAGKTLLGWCQIPATDILDGFSPVGSLRHLSYRLRDRDGSRGHGIVNIAVRLEESQAPVCTQRGMTRKTVIGKVVMSPGFSGYPVLGYGRWSVSCKEAEGVTSGQKVGPWCGVV